MFTLEICADRGCPRRANCYRYNVDPVDQIKHNHIVRAEATLKRIDEEVCSRYWPITLVNNNRNNTIERQALANEARY